MPVIKVREKTEEYNSGLVTGQSNAAVIPLFVNGLAGIYDTSIEYIRKEFFCSLYHTSKAFIADYKDYRVEADNSYQMIIDLLDSGLEVYVDPIDITNPNVLPGEEKSFVINVKNNPDTPEVDESLQGVTIKGNTFNPVFEGFFNFEGYFTEDIDEVLKSIIKESIRTGVHIEGMPTSYDNFVNIGPVIYGNINEEAFNGLLDALISIDDFNLNSLTNSYYYELRDKTRFNFKFLTTGAHANAYIRGSKTNLEIYGPFKAMIAICASLEEVDSTSGRGDSIALVDFEDWVRTNTEINIYDIMSSNFDLKDSYKNYNEYYKFADCTYPWLIRDDTKKIEYPGSFGYLKSFANSYHNKNNPDYYAIAGYNRGVVGDDSTFTPVERLGEAEMHLMQGDSLALWPEENTPAGESVSVNITINPIIRFQENSGATYIIWGNRVMLPPPVDEDGNFGSDKITDCNYFLNVRQLICDVKKECYFASAKVSFEPNDDITWFNFRSFVNPLLDSMVSNRGLQWYAWKRVDSDYKGQMKATLSIKPIEAVESFDITVYIRNTDEE